MNQECRDTNIVITPAGGRVTVTYNGASVADTGNALSLRERDLPERLYIPRADVDTAALGASSHTSYCPYKGNASYHHLTAGGQTAENAVWYYADPCDLVSAIKDHVAFWGDELKIEHSPS